MLLYQGVVKSLKIYCADIGSIKAGKFAWVRGIADFEGLREIYGSKDIEELAISVGDDLNSGLLVALGFECPLFVPLAENPSELSSARNGEVFKGISRPWSAGAGAQVLVIGLTQVVWILEKINQIVKGKSLVFLNWLEFNKVGNGLFIWEAFVTYTSKGVSDIADAENGVKCFANALKNISSFNAIKEKKVYSLVGAALLRTGWTKDISILETPCIVIRV